MSVYTESKFVMKLAELSSSQGSIQSLSQWLIHHRKHNQAIIKIWHKEFVKAQDHRKLTFVYLANDIIQNSRKKGLDYTIGFRPVFTKVLTEMAKVPGEKTKNSVIRIFRIWQERNIYDENVITELIAVYEKAWNDLHTVAPISFESEALSQMIAKATRRNEDEPNESSSGSPVVDQFKQRKSDKEHHHKRSSHHISEHHDSKRLRTKKEENKRSSNSVTASSNNNNYNNNFVDENIQDDSVVKLEVRLSPSPYKEPPTEEDLIQLIELLENMPSNDAVVRGNIANLPPEVSDISVIDEICIDSDIARTVQSQIVSGSELVQDYNQKLDEELETRRTASMKLQDFAQSQADLLAQAEQRLEEHQSHLKLMYKKLEALKSHVTSMPDFSKLPAVTDGLAPLPSASILFHQTTSAGLGHESS